ncbi:MAG: hypothetical protein MI757_07310 [Pirellulales bacterium]|nr:hypothetical protein [Pirellulales bacterium]
MADVFDPYREWLGLNYASREYPLNHYQILDLDRRDVDVETVQHAADEMLARVRSQRPGDRAADWSRLLDEIETARDCLIDTANKAAYDAQLVSSNLQRVVDPASADPNAVESKPLNLDPGAWSPPSFDAAPAQTEPVSSAPTDTDPPAALSSEVDATAAKHVSAASPGLPIDATPIPDAPSPAESQAFPRAPFDQESSTAGNRTAHETPPTAQPVSTGVDPMAPVAIPTAAPAAAPVAAPTAEPTGDPSAAPPAYDPVAPTAPTPEIAIDAGDDSRRPSGLSRTAMFGIAAALLLWVAGMATYFSGVLDGDDKSVATEKSPDAKDGTTDNQRPKDPDKGKVTERPKPKPKPKPRPTPQPESQPVPSPDPKPRPLPSPTPIPSPDPSPSPSPPPTPTPPPSPDPTPVPTPKPQPQPQPKPQPPTQTQIAAYLGHLRAARAALTSRDFDAAQRHLDTAYDTPMPADLEKRLVNLQALKDATHDFWLTAAEVIGKLEGGEEFKLSESTIIRIIEVNSRQILIRIAGQTKRYPVNDPPLGIARLMVANSLGKENPRTLIAFSASWATIPAADLDKARRYLRQAADAGADTSKLLQAIEDDYRP